MTITIDLTPELRAELVRQAATQGVEFDAYAASLIEATARLRNVPAAAGVPVMVPAEPSASPAGSAPAVSVHVYGGVPPTAVSVCE